MPFDRPRDFLEESGDYYTAHAERADAARRRTRTREECRGVYRPAQTGADIRAHLTFLLESTDRNTVFWIERRAAAGVRNLARGHGQSAFHTHLQATPIDVSELLSTSLVRYLLRASILTSATLTVSGGFEHIRKRLGMTTARELVVPSHFNYERQALLYLPPNMPDPREPDFAVKAAERIRRVLEITQGPRVLPVHEL